MNNTKHIEAISLNETKSLKPKLRFKEFKGEWEQKKLESQINSIDSGWSPQCEEYPSEENEWGVLKTTSVVWEGFNPNANKKLPSKFEPRPGLQVLANDILITRAGPTSRVGVPVHVDKVRTKLMISDKLIRLKVIENCSSQFLAVLLGNRKAQKQLISKSSGLAESQTNISQKILLKTKLFFPSTKEQQKIANFLRALDTKLHQLTTKKETLEQYKKAVMQQLFSQQLRFKDDDGSAFADWEDMLLGDCLDYKQPTKFLVSSTEYNDSYKTPVLTAGKTFILGHTNEIDNICQNYPLIIFDDFTTATKYVDFPFKAKSSAMKLLLPKESIDVKFIYEAMQNIRFEVGGHGRHWISIYSQLVISIPSLKEQQKIATYLSAIDLKIEAVQTQITNTQAFKKGLLQQMFV